MYSGLFSQLGRSLEWQKLVGSVGYTGVGKFAVKQKFQQFVKAENQKDKDWNNSGQGHIIRYGAWTIFWTKGFGSKRPWKKKPWKKKYNHITKSQITFIWASENRTSKGILKDIHTVNSSEKIAIILCFAGLRSKLPFSIFSKTSPNRAR